MNVFITGGAGFLGLHLARYLASKGLKSHIFDIAQVLDKSEYPEGTLFSQGDVCDEKAVRHAMKGCDVVIHAAAALPLRSREEILRVNVHGTGTVLEVALQEKVLRVVHISSTAVYGVPEKHPIYETDQLVGVGAYGESKILAEKECESYRKKGLIVSIIRPKTFLGTHRLGVFEILFDWVKDGKKIPVIGSGNNRYQLLEVEDLCDAIYRCLVEKDQKKVNDTFNVGSTRYDTVKEDLTTFFRAVHSSSRVMSTPAKPIKLALRLFEVLKLSPLYQWVYDTADKDSFVSTEKIQKTLDWNPQFSNSQALIRAYQWYEKHYIEIKSRGSGTTHTVGWKQGILSVAKKIM